MYVLSKIYSFRMRIALLLILTLVVTTGALYKLNQRAERTIIEEVDHQRRDLAKAISIAQQSLTSSQWLREFLKDQRLLEINETTGKPEPHRSHVQRILIVNSDGTIGDSSVKDDIDKPFAELGFGLLDQTKTIEIEPNQQSENLVGLSPYQVFQFPVQTNTGEVTLVIVFSAENLAKQLQISSRNRLLLTSGVLLVAIFIALIFIWEFTRPVGKLVEAAKQVTAGNFNVHLPVKRPDELGKLMAVFNEMIEGLRERRSLEARLYRAEQSAVVGRLASGIAHEIKNPLNYISLTIDYLRSKYAPVTEDARLLARRLRCRSRTTLVQITDR